MIRKRYVMSTLALTAVLAIGTIGSRNVFAESEDPCFTQKLAEHFSVDETEVSAIIDAVRDESLDTINENRLEKLNRLVDEGKISEEQGELIAQKVVELTSDNLTTSGSSKHEMSTVNGNTNNEMKNYLVEIGLDSNLLMIEAGFVSI